MTKYGRRWGTYDNGVLAVLPHLAEERQKTGGANQIESGGLIQKRKDVPQRLKKGGKEKRKKCCGYYIANSSSKKGK